MITKKESSGLRVEVGEIEVGYSTCYHCRGNGNFREKRELVANNFLERIKNLFEDRYVYRMCPICNGKGKKMDTIPGNHVYYKDGVEITQREWLEEAYSHLPEDEKKDAIDNFLYHKSERDYRIATAASQLKVLNAYRGG